jgi:hypothetical protein
MNSSEQFPEAINARRLIAISLCADSHLVELGRNSVPKFNITKQEKNEFDLFCFTIL